MGDIVYENLLDNNPAQVALGDVRALIPDIEQLKDPMDPNAEESYIFNDVTLNRYLRLNNQNVKLAAADACEALGSSEMLILKKITESDGRSTDGAALAKEYGAKATRLRAEAIRTDDLGDDEPAISAGLPACRPPIYDAERAARGGFWPWG